MSFLTETIRVTIFKEYDKFDLHITCLYFLVDVHFLLIWNHVFLTWRKLIWKCLFSWSVELKHLVIDCECLWLSYISPGVLLTGYLGSPIPCFQYTKTFKLLQIYFMFMFNEFLFWSWGNHDYFFSFAVSSVSIFYAFVVEVLILGFDSTEIFLNVCHDVDFFILEC